MATRSRAIRILTADSNQMACRLLGDALSKEPGLSVVASASDYDSIMRSLQAAKPDIALISAAPLVGLLRSVALASARSASQQWTSRKPKLTTSFRTRFWRVDL